MTLWVYGDVCDDALAATGGMLFDETTTPADRRQIHLDVMVGVLGRAVLVFAIKIGARPTRSRRGIVRLVREPLLQSTLTEVL